MCGSGISWAIWCNTNPFIIIIMDNIIFARNGPMREEYLCNTGTASQPEGAGRPKTAAEAASCKPVML